MTKNYTHLSQEQRYQIETLIKSGKKQKVIAELLGKSEATVSREIRRNGSVNKKDAYHAEGAQAKTQKRHKQKAKRSVFTRQMKAFCRNKLSIERWSPELISVEGKKEFENFVSHEWIYQWIWKCKFSQRKEDRADQHLYEYLAHGRRRKKRGRQKTCRGIIHNRVSIEKRPKIVDKRKRIGDIEVDLMLGRNRKGALLVALDRASLLIKLRCLKTKQTTKVNQALNSFFDPRWIKTFTFDNDQAFSAHQEVAKKYQVRTYFTRPYTSQDKGSVENRIGQIRRFIPKGIDLREINNKFVSEVEKKLNNRPVRKFNYKTPNQIFSEKLALIT